MIDLTQHHLFDGGMGSMLQRAGLTAGESPERLNLTAPEVVEGIHRAYVQAGADIITANTFGASRRKLGEDPAPYIAAAVAIARRAAGPDRYVALDVGPLGALLEPFGELTFDEAYAMFAEIMDAGAAAGAAIAWLDGGGYEEIIHTVVNALAIVSGMICDGAKASCAGKIAAAIDAGILGYRMYQQGQQFYGGDGILSPGVEATLDNVGRLGKIGMRSTDREILQIMLQH